MYESRWGNSGYALSKSESSVSVFPGIFGFVMHIVNLFTVFPVFTIFYGEVYFNNQTDLYVTAIFLLIGPFYDMLIRRVIGGNESDNIFRLIRFYTVPVFVISVGITYIAAAGLYIPEFLPIYVMVAVFSLNLIPSVLVAFRMLISPARSPLFPAAFMIAAALSSIINVFAAYSGFAFRFAPFSVSSCLIILSSYFTPGGRIAEFGVETGNGPTERSSVLYRIVMGLSLAPYTSALGFYFTAVILRRESYIFTDYTYLIQFFMFITAVMCLPFIAADLIAGPRKLYIYIGAPVVSAVVGILAALNTVPVRNIFPLIETAAASFLIGADLYIFAIFMRIYALMCERGLSGESNGNKYPFGLYLTLKTALGFILCVFYSDTGVTDAFTYFGPTATILCIIGYAVITVYITLYFRESIKGGRI